MFSLSLISHSSSLFPILQFSYLFSPPCPLKFLLVCVCGFGFGVTGLDTAVHSGMDRSVHVFKDVDNSCLAI